MSKSFKCQKCGGEVHEGEMFINTSLTPDRISSTYPLSSPYSVFGMPSLYSPEEKVKWKESSGNKSGWFLRGGDDKIFSIKGRRCINCGYVELYVNE